MFGVEIEFINGSLGWVDPCEEDPVEDNDVFIVTNSYDSYSYCTSDIKSWKKYDICQECMYDIRTWDCTESTCNKPL